MDTIDQIKKHIAKGEPDKAINLLLDYTKSNSPDIYDEALLLSGQYRQWKRGVTLGIQQSDTELRRIEMGIIDILNDQESYGKEVNSRRKELKPIPHQTPKSDFKAILLGVLGTIVAGFIFIMYIGTEEPAQNPNVLKSATQTSPKKVITPTQKESEEKVLGGNLTKSQFDNALASYQKSNAPINAPKLDINTVIQVRYAYENESGFFEKIPGTNKWIERDGNTHQVYAEYKEISRANSVITLYFEKNDLYIFLDVNEDRVYEKEGKEEREYIYNIIGVM